MNNGYDMNNNYNNYNNMPQPNVNLVPPKKNNFPMILIYLIITVVCFAGGFIVGYLSTEQESDDNTNNEETVDNNESTDNTNSNTNTTLYSVDSYKNYNFTMDMEISASGVSLTTHSKGTSDTVNKTDYMETSLDSFGTTYTTYTYSDYSSGIIYTSEDKKTWERDTTEGEESINLTDIIEGINNGEATSLGNNHYSVKLDLEESGEIYDGVYADVYTSNGYISKITYDLTDFVSSEGYSSFVITINITDINSAGSVVIPSSVTNTMSA